MNFFSNLYILIIVIALSGLLGLNISFLIILFLCLQISSKELGSNLPSLTKILLYGKLKERITGKKSPNQNLFFNIRNSLGFLFIFMLIFNLSGLNVFLGQLFVSQLSFPLLFLTAASWIRRYLPLAHQKEKFRLFLVGDMGNPSLSWLLTNIEILTQFFRPITLAARLWVNIWVGHLILSSLSTISLIIFSQSIVMGLSSLFLVVGFYFFETGIMCLQAFVFSYLVGVYWEENIHHSRLLFKKY